MLFSSSHVARAVSILYHQVKMGHEFGRPRNTRSDGVAPLTTARVRVTWEAPRSGDLLLFSSEEESLEIADRAFESQNEKDSSYSDDIV